MRDYEKFALAAAASAMLAVGVGIGGLVAEWQIRRDTRVLAIANNCGEYGARDGEFHWVTAQTAESIIVDERATQRAVEPLKPKVTK